MDFQIISKYFPDLEPEKLNQFGKLKDLYQDWNSKINVISRKDIDELYCRHVLHSLGISKVISFKPGTCIMDVGTGGGFPGIPLAIMFPECEFLLVDSIGKKIKVVEAVAEGVGLKNLKARHCRAEQVNEQFDFIVSRAVTDLSEFYGWINKKVRPEGVNSLKNGILYLKGGDLGEELNRLQNMFRYLETVSIRKQKKLEHHVHVFPLSKYFQEEFFETKKVVHIHW